MPIGKLQGDVWTTPRLPVLVFITAVLVIALIFGGLAWIILRLVWEKASSQFHVASINCQLYVGATGFVVLGRIESYSPRL